MKVQNPFSSEPYGHGSSSSHVLRVNSSGPAVIELKNLLAAAGHDPEEPGPVFGPKTLQAVLAFQNENDLDPDGAVGKNTHAALTARATAAEFSENPKGWVGRVHNSTGPAVEAIQQGLRSDEAKQGKSPIRVDGIFGPQTERAVKAFQTANQLQPTGKVDGELFQKLYAPPAPHPAKAPAAPPPPTPVAQPNPVEAPATSHALDVASVAQTFEAGDAGQVNAAGNDASYGLFKLKASDGSAAGFVDWLKSQPGYSSLASSLTAFAPGSSDFGKAWKALASAQPKLFASAQAAFAGGPGLFEPAAKAILDQTGIDVRQAPLPLQQAVLAMAADQGAEAGAGLFAKAVQSQAAQPSPSPDWTNAGKSLDVGGLISELTSLRGAASTPSGGLVLQEAAARRLSRERVELLSHYVSPERLSGMSVAQAMTKNPTSFSGTDTFGDARQKLEQVGPDGKEQFTADAKYRHPDFPVVDGEGKVVAVVSNRYLLDASKDPSANIFSPGDAALQTPVVIHQGDSLERAASLMKTHGVGHLPVVDDQGRLVGMLSSSDLLKARDAAPVAPKGVQVDGRFKPFAIDHVDSRGRSGRFIDQTTAFSALTGSDGHVKALAYTAGLAVDTDGSGSHHGDRTADDSTSWKISGKSPDADALPYVAIPPIVAKSIGAQLGDVVQVTTDNGHTAYAIYADNSDNRASRRLGEGSPALFRALGYSGITVDPNKGGLSSGAKFVVFPGSGKSLGTSQGGFPTAEQVQTWGHQLADGLTAAGATVPPGTTQTPAPPATPAAPPPVDTGEVALDVGARGSEVSRLQTLLCAQHLLTAKDVDGEFGPSTRVALERYQASHGLPVDGVADARTWSALAEGLPPVARAGEPPPATGNLRARILQIASSQIGLEEAHNENDGIITKYPKYFGRGSEAWCSDFASWVNTHAGNALNYASTRELTAHLKATGKWRGTTDAQPGDLVLFDWQRDGLADHVGIVTGVHRDADGRIVSVDTIEGNSGAVVKGENEGVWPHTRTMPTILGFGDIGGPPAAAAASAQPGQAAPPSPVDVLRQLAASGKELKQGARGSDVVALQTALHVDADGIFGAGTAKALQAYAQAHALSGEPSAGALTAEAARSLALELEQKPFVDAETRLFDAIARSARKVPGLRVLPSQDAARRLREIAAAPTDEAKWTVMNQWLSRVTDLTNQIGDENMKALDPSWQSDFSLTVSHLQEASKLPGAIAAISSDAAERLAKTTNQQLTSAIDLVGKELDREGSGQRDAFLQQLRALASADPSTPQHDPLRSLSQFLTQAEVQHKKQMPQATRLAWDELEAAIVDAEVVPGGAQGLVDFLKTQKLSPSS